MLLTKTQLIESLKTVNENVFSPLYLILEQKPLENVRRERLKHWLSESILLEGIVSDEVLSCTEEMFKQFLEKFSQRSKEQVNGSISVTGKLGEKNISATLYWTNCTEVGDVKPPEGNSVYRGNGLLVLINVTFSLYKNSIKGRKYQDEIERALLHEVNHVFEQSMAGFGYFHDEVMVKAKTYIQSNNVYDRMLAYIVYVSDESEQNAMCAELYKYCVQEHNIINPNNDYGIKPSAYEWLENLYTAHDFLIQHKNDQGMKDALAKYAKLSERDPRKWINNEYPSPRVEKPFDKDGWNYKKFRQRSDAGIKRFEKRIAQTLRNAQTKILGETYAMHINLYETMF